MKTIEKLSPTGIKIKIITYEYGEKFKTEYAYKLENGQLLDVVYLYDGWFHRTDGPAITIYNENGEAFLKEYWKLGRIHREDGPAIIRNGVEYFYVDGKRISKKLFYDNFSKKILKCEKCKYES